MERLRLADLQALLGFLPECYQQCDLHAFPKHILSGLQQLVPADIITYNEVNPRRGLIQWEWAPADSAPDQQQTKQVFGRHLQDHPVIAHYARIGDGPAAKISDFLSQRQFHDLGLYQEFFRQFPVEHQMAVGLSSRPDLVVGVAFNRSRRDFSERERLLLNLARPHLIQAYRNAEALTAIREAADVGGFGMLLLDARARISFATNQARGWITTYFGRPLHDSDQLPEALQAWVQRQLLNLGRWSDVCPPPEPLIQPRATKRLIVRLVPGSQTGGQVVLLLKEQVTDISADSLAALGLTRRECEVLALVAKGWTDAEIADSLVLSIRTVQKHMERIRTKLGVETRTAAAARAFQAARQLVG